MKIATVVGARPQFVKAAGVSRLLRQVCTEVLIHTGQHYDENMSAVFFEQLGIPTPEYNLNVGSGSHGEATGAMLARIEAVLMDEKPDWVLLYGDTNSTLAGALAASKIHLPIAHVEAGLRSFNRAMPEEINRLVADALSDLLFCPSEVAVRNLASEGITRGVHEVGDVMFDALQRFADVARTTSSIHERMGITDGSYFLATVHREENVDDARRLGGILSALEQAGAPVVFPVHPRTQKAIAGIGRSIGPNVRMIDPVGYLDMLRLLGGARLVLTDSGGLQKEAYWMSVPCVTLREETEWLEIVAAGWNVLAGSEASRIAVAIATLVPPAEHPPLYGEGEATQKIADVFNALASGT